MFLSEWPEFLSAPALQKKKLMIARVSMLLKSRAFLTRFRACFLRGQAKDLSAPRYIHFSTLIISQLRIWETLAGFKDKSDSVLQCPNLPPNSPDSSTTQCVLANLISSENCCWLYRILVTEVSNTMKFEINDCQLESERDSGQCKLKLGQKRSNERRTKKLTAERMKQFS